MYEKHIYITCVPWIWSDFSLGIQINDKCIIRFLSERRVFNPGQGRESQKRTTRGGLAKARPVSQSDGAKQNFKGRSKTNWKGRAWPL